MQDLQRARGALAGALAAALLARPAAGRTVTPVTIDELKAEDPRRPGLPEAGDRLQGHHAAARRRRRRCRGRSTSSAAWAEPREPDIVLGAEARGFITGGALACRLGCGFARRAQAGQAAVADGQRQVRARVRPRRARDARRRDHAGPARADPRRRARDRRHGQGEGRPRRAARRRSSPGVLFIIQLDFLNGARPARRLRRPLADPLLEHDVRRRYTAMYDALTDALHVLVPTPRRDEGARSRPSGGSTRLPGSAHPAVYRVEFACGCGGEHPGLVTHDELDWAPLGAGERTPFLNLMTSRLDDAGDELGDLAARRIEAGDVAVELLLLPGGAAAARLPVRRSRCSRPGGRAAASGSRFAAPSAARLGQPRLARRTSTCPSTTTREIGVVEHVFARRRRRARRSVPRRALRRRVRLAPPPARRLTAPTFTPGSGMRRGGRLGRW